MTLLSSDIRLHLPTACSHRAPEVIDLYKRVIRVIFGGRAGALPPERFRFHQRRHSKSIVLTKKVRAIRQYIQTLGLDSKPKATSLVRRSFQRSGGRQLGTTARACVRLVTYNHPRRFL